VVDADWAARTAGLEHFISAQKPNQWLASKFKGTDVLGADNKSIGSISDILLDKSGKTLYLTDNRGRDKAALQSIDLASGQETLLLADPFADVLPGLLFHPKTGRVQTASAYFGRLRRHFLERLRAEAAVPRCCAGRRVAPGAWT
jgi:hypothetical protein